MDAKLIDSGLESTILAPDSAGLVAWRLLLLISNLAAGCTLSAGGEVLDLKGPRPSFRAVADGHRVGEFVKALDMLV